MTHIDVHTSHDSVRKRTFHVTVFSAITALYALSIGNLCLQWYILSNGRLIEILVDPLSYGTQLTYPIPIKQHFIQGKGIPFSPWAHWVNVFCVYTEFVIADGLLVCSYSDFFI